jgi:hypothetical protein
MARSRTSISAARNVTVTALACLAGAAATAVAAPAATATSQQTGAGLLDVTWGPIVAPAPGDGSQEEVKLALTPAGEPAVVWYEYEYTPTSDREGLYFRQMVEGVWQPRERVARTGGEPQMAIDRRGVVTVVYERWRNRFGPEIAEKRRTLAGDWTPARIISPVTRDDGVYTGSRDVMLAMNAAGDAVASWWFGSLDGGPVPRDQAAYRPAGGAWTNVKTLTRPSWSVGLQDLTISPRGTATLAFLNRTHTLRSVQYRDGRWRRSALITRRGGSGASLTHAPGGPVYVVWPRRLEQATVIRASTLREDGWTSPELMGGRRSRNREPVIAVDRNGVATVLWVNGTDRRVEGTRWRSTGELEPVQEVGGEGVRFGVSLAGNRRGDSVAAWTTPLRTTDNPYDRKLEVAYRAHDDESWSEAFVVSDDEPANFSPRPQPVLARQGQASIAWVGGADSSKVRLRQTVSTP